MVPDQASGVRGATRVVTLDESWRWPLAIVLGFCVIVVVNALFIMVAVSGADPVVPSYVEAER